MNKMKTNTEMNKNKDREGKFIVALRIKSS